MCVSFDRNRSASKNVGSSRTVDVHLGPRRTNGRANTTEFRPGTSKSMTLPNWCLVSTWVRVQRGVATLAISWILERVVTRHDNWAQIAQRLGWSGTKCNRTSPTENDRKHQSSVVQETLNLLISALTNETRGGVIPLIHPLCDDARAARLSSFQPCSLLKYDIVSISKPNLTTVSSSSFLSFLFPSFSSSCPNSAESA